MGDPNFRPNVETPERWLHSRNVLDWNWTRQALDRNAHDALDAELAEKLRRFGLEFDMRYK